MLKESTCVVSKSHILHSAKVKQTEVAKKYEDFKQHRIHKLTTIPCILAYHGFFSRSVLRPLTEQEALSKFHNGQSTKISDNGAWDYYDTERTEWDKALSTAHQVVAAIEAAPSDTINASLELINYIY